MRRGDLLTVSLPGDFGKPRPALVIQSDLFVEKRSVAILPLTSASPGVEGDMEASCRVQLRPDAKNGLQKTSQVMTDKIFTVNKDKTGPIFGRVDADALAEIERKLAVFLGLAE